MVSRLSPWAVEHECELCGKNTAVNLRTGRMKIHRPAGSRLGTRTTCPASNTLMVEPDPPNDSGTKTDQAGHELRTHRCRDCAQDIKVSARDGQMYSHNAPGTSESCPGSGRQVDVGDPALGMVIEIKRVEEPAVRSKARPVQSSNSVHAIPAGLPSSGRRRK